MTQEQYEEGLSLIRHYESLSRRIETIQKLLDRLGTPGYFNVFASFFINNTPLLPSDETTSLTHFIVDKTVNALEQKLSKLKAEKGQL